MAARVAASSLVEGGGGGESGMLKLGTVGMVRFWMRWRSTVYGEPGAEIEVSWPSVS